jgi:hypothetical protein
LVSSPGAAGRHLAHQLAERALGQGVRLDRILRRQLANGRRVDVRAGDRPPQHPRMSEARNALAILITNAHRVDDGQPTWMAGGHEAVLEGNYQRLGNGVAAARPADQQRIAVMNQARGVCRIDQAHQPSGPRR